MKKLTFVYTVSCNKGFYRITMPQTMPDLDKTKFLEV